MFMGHIQYEAKNLSTVPISSQGIEHLSEAQKRGKGAFYLMAHYGNWEALGIYWGHENLSQVYSIARKLDNPYLESFSIS